MLWYILGLFAFFWFITSAITEIYGGWYALGFWIVAFGWIWRAESLK
jgi:hypothetical protein